MATSPFDDKTDPRRALAACQPRDLLGQVLDHALYQGERPALTAAALDRAAAT